MLVILRWCGHDGVAVHATPAATTPARSRENVATGVDEVVAYFGLGGSSMGVVRGNSSLTADATGFGVG
jgi:hypothetical protein